MVAFRHAREAAVTAGLGPANGRSIPELPLPARFIVGGILSGGSVRGSAAVTRTSNRMSRLTSPVGKSNIAAPPGNGAGASFQRMNNAYPVDTQGHYR